MTDIVERLRRYKRDRSGYAEYCHQVADTIERLQRDGPQIMRAVEDGNIIYGSMREVLEDTRQALASTDAVCEAQAEQIRVLREALERIESSAPLYCAELALAALEKTK